MTDKNRHRPTPVPKGQMPNWALVLCLASGFALVALFIWGAENIGTFSKTPRSARKWCKTCGGHLLTEHPALRLVDVYPAVLPELGQVQVLEHPDEPRGERPLASACRVAALAYARNVLAGECFFTLEWRPLPGQPPEKALEMVDAVTSFPEDRATALEREVYEQQR